MAGLTDLTRFRIDINDYVAEVVLNRPDKLNVMDKDFFEEFGRIIEQLDNHADVNVILIWAEGRLFTAGLDLKAAFLPGNDHDSQVDANVDFLKTVRRWQESFNTPRKCKKPVIAAVHNRCIGGGIDLITACDIRLATQDASFSVKETEVGIVADLGTLQRLHKIVGSGLTREMAFTSNGIDANRAVQCGLVNTIFADQATMLEAGRQMAKKIAALSPLVVQGTKVVLNYSEEHSLEDGLAHVALWNTAFIKSDDLTEAMMSFMQKRTPKFRNRL